ncbi:MAG: hypothetical protein U0359_07170 [Byssovorax sp.]
MRRILVFQPDATAPGGASLPVGLVREDGLVPRLQILVKASFGYEKAEDGAPPPAEARLLRAQEAIVLARRRGQPSDAESAPDALVVPPDAAVEVLGGHLVRLPGIRPRVSIEGGGRAAREVPLTCDSLWIDDEGARFVAVWRGRVETKNLRARDVEEITLTLWHGDVRLSQGERPQVACYAFAVERDGDDPGPQSKVEEARIAMALRRAMQAQKLAPSLDLQAFAALQAELGERREPRAETLKRQGIHPLDWAVEEKAWLDKIGESAAAGDGSLAASLGAAYAAAQDRLGAPDEAQKSLADYIDIRARLDAGQSPDKVLGDHRMTLPAWMRLDRRWKREAQQNPDLGEELDRLVKEASAAGPGGGV